MNTVMLGRIVDALQGVGGLRAIVLGGSQARGTAGPNSDYDVGLYYDPDAPLDTDALALAVSSIVDDPDDVVTDLGAWGPWINGGGWLSVSGQEVDLLYRDLRAVSAVIAEGREGRFSMNYQPGHPHGFASTIWMGEISICRPLWDPHGDIAALKSSTQPYPEPLRDSILRRFGWEAGFAADNAAIALRKADAVHIAGCAYRVVSCVAQTIFALNRVYLINEKGAIDEAARMAMTIPNLSMRAKTLWRDLNTADGIARSVKEMTALANDVATLARRFG
jgi:predicted nucleotidyltransferase